MVTGVHAGIIRAADLQGASSGYPEHHTYVLLQTDTPICWGLK
jgi:hypothetical protein